MSDAIFSDVLNRLGIRESNSGVCADAWVDSPGGEEVVSLNPATGRPLASVRTAACDDGS